MPARQSSPVVLVTGCRTGIGAAAVRALAEDGCSVYAGLRDPAAPGPEAEGWERLGVVPLGLDVTNPEQRREAVRRVLAERGRIDALVNNAGIATGGFLEQLEEDELRRVFEVNLFAAWAMTREVLPAMREARAGLILQVSSMAGRQALPAFGAYAASKFALEGMTEAWRHELRRFGVRCVLLEPGAYRTRIFDAAKIECRRFRDPESPYASEVPVVEGLVRGFVDRRARDPIEVARKIVELVRAPAPGLRHPIGPGVRLRTLLLRFLPFGAMEWMIAKALDRQRRALGRSA